MEKEEYEKVYNWNFYLLIVYYFEGFKCHENEQFKYIHGLK